MSFSPDFSSKISPQLFKIETSNLVYGFTTTSCMVGLKMGLLLCVLLYICSFFFLSRFFIKDFSTTDRNFKFDIRFTTTSCIVRLQIGILLFVLPQICYLFYLSMQSILQCFVIDFSGIFQDRRYIFYMSIDNGLLYCGIENRHSPVYSSLYMSFFLSLHIFVKDISTTI